MLKCRKCGFLLKDSDKFCPNCGQAAAKSREIIRPALKTQLRGKKVVCWACDSKISPTEAQNILERFGQVYCDACGQPQNVDKTELDIRKALLRSIKP